MQITGEGISLLIILVVVAGLVLGLVKFGVKIAVSLVLILLVFKVGFMFTGTELNDIFKIDKVFEERSAGNIINFFDEFRQKGDDVAIMDADAVYGELVGSIQKGAEITTDIFKDINIKGFVESLIVKINSSNVEVVDIETLQEGVSKAFPSKSKQEIDEITDEVISQINKPIT